MERSKLFITLIAAVVLACGAVIPTQAHAARHNVIISEQNWTGSTVICQVMKYVLEKDLKVPVKVEQLSGAVTWVGMDRGDVDVFSDIWETAEAAGMKKYAEQRKTCGLTLSYPNAPQGWYIPRYVQKKYHIYTVQDLKGKEKIFDIDGDGKGDIWVGPTSWKNNEIQKDRIRDYGLNFTALGVEQWAWLATLKEAYKKKKPVIFYYWEPEWIFTQYDLVMIKEPPYDPAKWHFVEKHPEQSHITCAMQPSNVYVGYSMKLKSRLPKVYQFYKNWHIPIKEVSNLIYMVTKLPGHPKMSAPDAAKKWVGEHTTIVNSWLKGIK